VNNITGERSNPQRRVLYYTNYNVQTTECSAGLVVAARCRTIIKQKCKDGGKDAISG